MKSPLDPSIPVDEVMAALAAVEAHRDALVPIQWQYLIAVLQALTVAAKDTTGRYLEQMIPATLLRDILVYCRDHGRPQIRISTASHMAMFLREELRLARFKDGCWIYCVPIWPVLERHITEFYARKGRRGSTMLRSPMTQLANQDEEGTADGA